MASQSRETAANGRPTILRALELRDGACSCRERTRADFEAAKKAQQPLKIEFGKRPLDFGKDSACLAMGGLAWPKSTTKTVVAAQLRRRFP